MYFADALTLDAPRPLPGGYVAVRAKAARTGVYDYLASEPSIADALPAGHSFKPTDVVKVLRDENTVFDQRSVHSFIGKPITDNHPSVAVTADNHRQLARGTIMGAKWEEGGYLAFDLLLTDAEAIAKVNGGKRELSNGYSAELEFGDFTAPDGTKCHARQKSIVGNHVALVDRGRAGSECAIKDGFAVCDALPSNILDSLTKTEKPVKTMLIDGLTVDVSNADTAEATIKTLIASRDAAGAKVAGLETQVATLTAAGQTKDAQITTLEQQVKDAKPTPAQLRDAGKALIVVADKAKAMGVTVSDEMDEAQIMSATVAKHMGDAAKDWTADQIAASFAVLTKDAKPAAPGVQSLGAPVVIGDAAAKEAAALADANDHNAWRSKSAA
ncbi:DUF2213 domain-containing protein [Sphingobium yanoikuyae]|uniref:DUF2213 domain-containing protein n=1 Tax=Sphingobium yanoikuyae TaxID=13690 RepID=UPI0035C69BCC